MNGVTGLPSTEVEITNVVGLQDELDDKIETPYVGTIEATDFTSTGMIETFNTTTHAVSSTGFNGDPPILSIDTATTFNISAGIVLLTDNDTGVVTRVVVPAQTGVTPEHLNVATATYISIDSSGDLVHRTTQATPTQRRNTASVGVVSHADQVDIALVSNFPQICLNPASQCHDLMRALGWFSTAGNEITGLVGLEVAKAAGTGFGLFENASVTNKDPHNVTLDAASPATMFQTNQDVSLSIVSATVDPLVYDNAGTQTTIPANNNAVIHRIYLFANNQIVWMFGQEVFSTYSDAKEAVGRESFIVPTVVLTDGLLLGRWVLKKNATNMNDTDEATWVPSSNVSSGAGSITTLQAAYNASVQPQIVTSATRGAFVIQRGSALDTNTVIEVKDGGGQLTASITGEGTISTAVALLAPGLDAGSIGPLALGSTVATSVEIADAAIDTDVKGPLITREGITNTGLLETFVNGTNIVMGNSTTGQSLGSGDKNIIMGRNAGSSVNQFDANVLIGEECGTKVNSHSNVMVGADSGRYLSGGSNTCLGTLAGEGVDGSSTGFENVFLGRECGQAITTGAGNTFAGFNSGNDTTSGDFNTCLGKGSRVSPTDDNQTALGYQAVCTAPNEVVIGNGDVTHIRSRVHNTVTLGTTGVRWSDVFTENVTETSDASLKHIDPTFNKGLEWLSHINPISFKWINGGKRTHYGFNATEIGALISDGVIPDTGLYVKGSNGGEDGLRKNQLLAPIVQCIHELKAEIDMLKQKKSRKRSRTVLNNVVVGKQTASKVHKLSHPVVPVGLH